jgi:hypothetical protein
VTHRSPVEREREGERLSLESNQQRNTAHKDMQKVSYHALDLSEVRIVAVEVGKRGTAKVISANSM